MTGVETAGVLLGCYGAILSTYTAVSRWRENRRQVKVVVGHGLPTYPDHVGEPCLQITVQNHGQRPVKVTNVTFRLPNKSTLLLGTTAFMDKQLPCELRDGDHCMLLIDARVLATEMRSRGHSGTLSLRGIAQDAVGGEYVSKKYGFQIDEWLTKA